MLANGRTVVANAWLRGLMPDPDIGFDEWAEEYRYLPPDASEPGKFRLTRTPYMRDILRDCSPNSGIEEITIVKGGQIAGSETINNAIGATVMLAPGRVLLVQPTVDTMKEYMRERIDPLFEHTPVLRERLANVKSRDGSNTVKFKRFSGGFIAGAGANSASSLQSRAVRYVFLDEIDRYPKDVDGQGDPVGMAIKRTDTFKRNRKIIKNSTPGNADDSRIMASAAETDCRHYFMPCPHCRHMDYFRSQRFTYTTGRPESAGMLCVACGSIITERHKTWMMDPANGAEWRPTRESKNPRKRGYFVPGFLSPMGWRSWEAIAEDHEIALLNDGRGDNTLLKKVVNLDFGEPYKDQGEQAPHIEIQKRAEPYPMRTIPAGGLILTAAVDVQHNRLEAKAMAWGRDEEGWVVDYQVFWGDPMSQPVWDVCDNWLRRPMRHEPTGTEMRIACCAIDASDGHTMHEVLKFVRPRTNRLVMAIKGHRNADAPMLPPPTPVEVDRAGVKVRTGDLLWMLGVNQIKNTLFARLKVATPGRNYIHFGTWLPDEYWPHLASERLSKKYINGQVYKRWVKNEGMRNEGWDLLVYNYAAALRLGINRWGETNWAECERLLTQANLFADPVEVIDTDPYCKPPVLEGEATHEAPEPLPPSPPPRVVPPAQRQVARSVYLR